MTQHYRHYCGYTYRRDAEPLEHMALVKAYNDAVVVINRHEVTPELPLLGNAANGVEFGLVDSRPCTVYVRRRDELAIIGIRDRGWSFYFPGLWDYRRCVIPLQRVGRVKLYVRAGEGDGE